MAKRLVHCWKPGPLLWVGHEAFAGSVCMLRDDHPGPCEFTREDEIVIGCTDPDRANDSDLHAVARAAAIGGGDG